MTRPTKSTVDIELWILEKIEFKAGEYLMLLDLNNARFGEGSTVGNKVKGGFRISVEKALLKLKKEGVWDGESHRCARMTIGKKNGQFWVGCRLRDQ